MDSLSCRLAAPSQQECSILGLSVAGLWHVHDKEVAFLDSLSCWFIACSRQGGSVLGLLVAGL